MGSCYWFKFAGFAVVTYLISMSASAIMVKPGTIPAGTGASAQVQPAMPASMKSGVISAIDISRNIVVIGGATYMFVPALTKLRSSNPLINGNPLKLAPGQSVRFLTTEESGGKQRITEVILK
jgi:hypothetical protein